MPFGSELAVPFEMLQMLEVLLFADGAHESPPALFP